MPGGRGLLPATLLPPELSWGPRWLRGPGGWTVLSEAVTDVTWHHILLSLHESDGWGHPVGGPQARGRAITEQLCCTDSNREKPFGIKCSFIPRHGI